MKFERVFAFSKLKQNEKNEPFGWLLCTEQVIGSTTTEERVYCESKEVVTNVVRGLKDMGKVLTECLRVERVYEEEVPLRYKVVDKHDMYGNNVHNC